MNKSLEEMSISEIAKMIQEDWKKVNFAAKPYLSAMYSLGEITDNYGMDNGTNIVLYFLSNAGSWRGDTARRVKAELKRRLK